MFELSDKMLVVLCRHCLKIPGTPQPSAWNVAMAVSMTVRLTGGQVIFAGMLGAPETMEMALKKPRISTGTVPSHAIYRDSPTPSVTVRTPKLSPSIKPAVTAGLMWQPEIGPIA